MFGDDYAAARWYLDMHHVPSGRDGTGWDDVPSFCCGLGWIGGWDLDLDFWMTDYWDAHCLSLLFGFCFCCLAFNDGRHALFGIFVCRRGGRAFLLMGGWLVGLAHPDLVRGLGGGISSLPLGQEEMGMDSGRWVALAMYLVIFILRFPICWLVGMCVCVLSVFFTYRIITSYREKRGCNLHGSSGAGASC